MSLTDLLIGATIAPTSLRWPGSNVAFEKLKLAVDALRALVRGCDDACRIVENDRDLTPDGVQRRVAGFGTAARRASGSLQTLLKTAEQMGDSEWLAQEANRSGLHSSCPSAILRIGRNENGDAMTSGDQPILQVKPA